MNDEYSVWFNHDFTKAIVVRDRQVRSVEIKIDEGWGKYIRDQPELATKQIIEAFRFQWGTQT